jgi:DNA repair protein RecO (recombination protein O)
MIINGVPKSCARSLSGVRASARRQIRMPLRESEAIVLRTFPLGEGDRIVSFLDRGAGRLRGVARGARHPKSRFGSTLEPLSHDRIWYFERETRELVRINQCELIESFMAVQSDYSIANFLALISEVTESVLPEREPAEAQFRLVLLAARAIKSQAAMPPVLAYFSGWTARLAGWFSFLGQCAKCGRAMDGEPGFASIGSSGILCATCRQPWMISISPAALAAGRQILTGKLDHFLKEKYSTDTLGEISDYALNIIEHHAEKKLVTRQMISAINNCLK